MSFLGMGSLEVLAILLVAFIFLGPERMVEAARFLGKIARDARRLTDELPNLVMEDDKPAEAPIVHRRGGPRPGGDAVEDAAQAEDPAAQDDGPVAFRSEQPVAAPEQEPEEKRDAE
jgi:Sec-independent protein translocase protein TatA